MAYADPEAGAAEWQAQVLADFLRGGLAMCEEWATSGAQAPLEELCAMFPPWPAAEPPPLDVDALAVVVCEATDLASASKLASFREQLAIYMAETGSQPSFEDGSEPWYDKDAFQMLAELILLRPIGHMLGEVQALLVEVVLDFGRDGMACIALLLCLRGFYGMGRADDAEETAQLLAVAQAAFAVATEYLLSEYVGQLSLAQVMAIGSGA